MRVDHTAWDTYVGGAGGDLLAGEGGQVPGVDGRVGLDHLGGTEGPAGAAVSLVLHVAHGSLVSPVNRLGQIFGSLHSETLHAAGDDGSFLKNTKYQPFYPHHPHHLTNLVSSHVEGLELALGEVAELVDSHGPAGSGLVVLLGLLQVLRENIESPLVLRPGVEG